MTRMTWIYFNLSVLSASSVSKKWNDGILIPPLFISSFGCENQHLLYPFQHLLYSFVWDLLYFCGQNL